MKLIFSKPILVITLFFLLFSPACTNEGDDPSPIIDDPIEEPIEEPITANDINLSIT